MQTLSLARDDSPRQCASERRKRRLIRRREKTISMWTQKPASKIDRRSDVCHEKFLKVGLFLSLNQHSLFSTYSHVLKRYLARNCLSSRTCTRRSSFLSLTSGQAFHGATVCLRVDMIFPLHPKTITNNLLVERKRDCDWHPPSLVSLTRLLSPQKSELGGN